MFNTNQRLKIILAVICFFAFSAPVFASSVKASDFALEDLEGKTVRLSDYKGKNVILFFWSTWCPYCVREMRKLKNDYKKIISDNFELLAVNAGEKLSTVARFLKNNPVDFQVLLDSDMMVSFDYGVMGLPTFLIINKEGNIVFVDYRFPAEYKDYVQKKYNNE